MPDLKIRNVDKLIIAKLDQEAADRHMSREAFLRMYLQNLAVLNELTPVSYTHLTLPTT